MPEFRQDNRLLRFGSWGWSGLRRLGPRSLECFHRWVPPPKEVPGFDEIATLQVLYEGQCASPTPLFEQIPPTVILDHVNVVPFFQSPFLLLQAAASGPNVSHRFGTILGG